ncbi:calumenin-B [Drosophila sulfurigaster albostrigata]|uniref:calumenin-B n=1 Tax=Drosophila sulfurigaster albostrigata TaxID=89887 RepID=UPI002D21D331|nr:calumenin-B [Drosophila sulfurigaster albostrigata]
MRIGLFVLLVAGAISIAAASSIPAGELPHDPLEHDSLHHKHFEGDQHNQQYDHEAFLGADEAKKFDELTPEESKRRLGVIVDRIDEDKDGFITLAELKNWIKFTQRRYIDEDVGRVWRKNNPENNETISWEVYRKTVYGFMDVLDKEELEQEENGVSYKSMLARDRRRWAVADLDLDDKLTREEFTAFLHPEEHPSMRDLVLQETTDDLDKDKDGKISVDEYIGDMYRPSEANEEEPEWVLAEREAFTKHRDLDGDGYLTETEIRQWIVPNDFDHAESEAKHLIFEADVDHDEQLTKDEVLDKYDVFVGSQATDFGEALARHDEF